MQKPKICLYLEFYHFFGGILFRGIGTGLLSSYKNQIRIMRALDVPFVEAWDDSCDVLQINTPWIKSRYLMRRARRQGKKVIVWAHVTVEDAMQVFWFMPFIAPLFKRYLIASYDSADLILCPSSYTRGLVIAYGIDPAKVAVQSNGVDTDSFFKDETLRDTYRQAHAIDRTAVGTLALVLPRKGVDTFIAVARRLPLTSFFWFGKIYSGALVRSLPNDLPVNVIFTGFVQHVNAALNALDIFVFPSYEENQGMAVLEAAAVGLPIVVRDIPVYADWLHDGVNCRKASTDDEFVHAIEELSRDAGMRERLGAAALELARLENLTEAAKRMQAHYQRLGVVVA
jgi:1,2-diacylglycerol-3-alpha-glucose alpha-1,2-glucosyltransferase